MTSSTSAVESMRVAAITDSTDVTKPGVMSCRGETFTDRSSGHVALGAGKGDPQVALELVVVVRQVRDDDRRPCAERRAARSLAEVALHLLEAQLVGVGDGDVPVRQPGADEGDAGARERALLDHLSSRGTTPIGRAEPEM